MRSSAFAARAGLLAFLVVVGSMLVACAAAPPPEPGPPGYPYCTAQEHEAAVCQQLRRTVLIEPDGTRVPLHVVECVGGEPSVEVTWARRDAGTFLYRARVAFDVPEPRAPMLPHKLAPDIHEWPCADDACRIMQDLAPGTRIGVPIVQQCPAGADTSSAEVVLPLPPATAEGCSWCVDAGDSTERYVILEHSWRPNMTLEVVIEVREGIVSVRSNGKARRILPKEEADELMSSLEKLWRGPLESHHSCRDGTTTLVLAWALYRFDDPLGEPRVLVEAFRVGPVNAISKVGAGPGFVAVWDSYGSGAPALLLDVETGATRTLAGWPDVPPTDILFRSMAEGAVVFESIGLALTRDGGKTFHVPAADKPEERGTTSTSGGAESRSKPSAATSAPPSISRTLASAHSRAVSSTSLGRTPRSRGSKRRRPIRSSSPFGMAAPIRAGVSSSR
ncbi:hypothetical protein [Polyangium mundeleinium]|uniref:Lipoprotein n=1 Tax=Polyangium mundeleinium TaxID=2995306 RepID=A0ABT5EXX9_9BACT|nr:hypothetical protein [Polyangium mundeleinium]MDC0746668.1 hypothetical protein [Polyangium mundeleinium]